MSVQDHRSGIIIQKKKKKLPRKTLNPNSYSASQCTALALGALCASCVAPDTENAPKSSNSHRGRHFPKNAGQMSLKN